jgi:hypothetical protein
MEVLQFIFSSFWIWLGCCVFLSMIIKGIFYFYNRMLRHIAIMKHGYPEGCNADGKFNKPVKNDN